MYCASHFRRLVVLGFALVVAVSGCSSRNLPSPVQAGYNTTNLIDVTAQAEASDLAQQRDCITLSAELESMVSAIVYNANPEAVKRPPRHVLCLSGGGSYGAFSVGVLSGWTRSGTRPEFDVVTGVSTGALIAPLAFLGPEYDKLLQTFYTTLRNDDVYEARPVFGLFEEGLADNSLLAERVDSILTPELVDQIAYEHVKGRRLYVGTTELEGRRLVIWDVGAIATKGKRKLIKQILLGSSAIPGFFPPAHIQVTVDGKCFEELHGDGSVSTSLFFRPPYLPPEQRSELSAANLYNTQVWCIVAGKLYADPVDFRPNALQIASNSISTVLYAKARSDLTRIFNMCLLNGMDFHLTSIPTNYPAPQSGVQFEPGSLRKLFEIGNQLTMTGRAWRTTPPGFEEDEADLERADVHLTELPRGGLPANAGPSSSHPRIAPGPTAIPVMPREVEP